MGKDNIFIENAEIRFRNFSGKEGQFNPAGIRNFCVLLDREIAEELTIRGLNVRWLKAKEEGDADQAYISVAVRFDNYPPKIVLISSRGQSLISDNEVNILDWAEIETADIVISTSKWSKGAKSGIKAYLKDMYVTIVEDKFEKKYDRVPDSATACIGRYNGN